MKAIAAYPSQTGPEPVKDWLASFARVDEPFYPEMLTRDPRANGRLVRDAPSGPPSGAAVEGERVGPYTVLVENEGEKLVLTRDVPGAEPRVLRRWFLPYGATRSAPHAFTLRVEPRADDGPVVEITVRRDGAVMGLAVDVAGP